MAAYTETGDMPGIIGLCTGIIRLKSGTFSSKRIALKRCRLHPYQTIESIGSIRTLSNGS
jgi:hypothetical protein